MLERNREGSSVYTKTYHLMTKQKVHFPVYHYAHASMYYVGTHHNLIYACIDPFHVTSRGARSGPPWRTTGAVFYGENIKRLPLPLLCKEGKHPFSHGCSMLD